MSKIAEELARRQADEHGDYPSIYLTIYDLGRFRDLRKSDDDYGFSSKRRRREAQPFEATHHDPPRRAELGIHVLCWCDTVGNLNRTFERSTAGEFEQRILFQMSINDSSALIDSPAAGRLGENRGLYFNEELGRTEKFRPYGLPDQAWLDHARDLLAAKPKPPYHARGPLQAAPSPTTGQRPRRGPSRPPRDPPVAAPHPTEWLHSPARATTPSPTTAAAPSPRGTPTPSIRSSIPPPRIDREPGRRRGWDEQDKSCRSTIHNYEELRRREQRAARWWPIGSTI